MDANWLIFEAQIAADGKNRAIFAALPLESPLV
jgi:hypothetical protein